MKHARRRRIQRKKGGSKFTDFLKKAHNWIKSKRIVSTVGNALGNIGVPYAGMIGKTASALGYGRRRRRTTKRIKGSALRLSGMGSYGPKRLYY